MKLTVTPELPGFTRFPLTRRALTMPGKAAKVIITERQHDILLTLRNAVTAPSHLLELQVCIPRECPRTNSAATTQRIASKRFTPAVAPAGVAPTVGVPMRGRRMSHPVSVSDIITEEWRGAAGTAAPGRPPLRRLTRQAAATLRGFRGDPPPGSTGDRRAGAGPGACGPHPPRCE